MELGFLLRKIMKFRNNLVKTWTRCLLRSLKGWSKVSASFYLRRFIFNYKIDSFFIFNYHPLYTESFWKINMKNVTAFDQNRDAFAKSSTAFKSNLGRWCDFHQKGKWFLKIYWKMPTFGNKDPNVDKERADCYGW